MNKTTYSALLLALAVSGSALIVRAFAGPYRIGMVSVGSPVNAQSFFGISLTVLLLLAARKGEGREQDWSRDQRWSLTALLALLLGGASLYLRSSSDIILSDDFWLLQNWKSGIDEFPVQVANAFFRPIGFLAVALIGLWAGTNLTLWHVVGLVLHLVTSGLVYVFVSRLISGRWTAFVAAAVFAVHGSRPEAVVWISGWFDVFATAFLLTGLLFFLRDIDRDAMMSRLASLACMAAAILSKEIAFAFPLLLPLVAWRRGKLTRKVLPRLGLFVAVAALLFLYRWHRLGGIGGYVDRATGEPQVLSFGLLGIAKVLLLRIWAFFCYPLNWSVEPSLLLSAMLALCVVLYAVLATAKSPRRDILFALGFILISLQPAMHQLLIGADMEKSRGLYLPSVGFCMLLGVAVESLVRQKLRWAVCVGLLSFHLAVLQHNLAIWRRVSGLAKATCVSAGQHLQPGMRRVIVYDLPRIMDGVYFFQNGFEECLEMTSGRTIDAVEIRGPEDSATLDDATLLLFWDNDSQRIMPVQTDEWWRHRRPHR